MSETDKNVVPIRVLSVSPHVHSGASVRGLMLDVILALAPAAAMSLWLFGWNAARLILVCVAACVAFEFGARRLMRRDPGVGDLSAVVTGLLLAFNLPPTLPSWMAAVGSFFAIVIAKQVFGGIGYNPFNPALIGRVALLVSFPVQMTTWGAPGRLAAALRPALAPDGITCATPLGWVKTALGQSGESLPLAMNAVTAREFLLGFKPGCIGEVSGAALLLGAAYLLWRRCIRWQVPVFYLGTVAAIATVAWMADPAHQLGPLFHLLSGGVLLGALFMATDMVTTPVTASGMAWFGAGCGVLTMLIRLWGGYPEGVSFAILLMNAVTPLINRATRPRVFGRVKKKKDLP